MDSYSYGIKSSTYSSLNILFHSIILFTFLSLFFFLYISKIEQQAFQDELKGLISDNLLKSLNTVPESVLAPTLKTILPELDAVQQLYQGETKFTQERNILIKFSSTFIVLLMLALFLTIILTLKFGCDRSVKNVGFIVLENLLIFAFIGMVEYTFFTKIAIKYIPTTPSLMIQSLINAFKQQLNPK